jgi:hypothetical protein
MSREESNKMGYRPPRKHWISLEERKGALEEQIELDALKVRLRTQQAEGAIGVLRGMAQAARGQVYTRETPPAQSIPTKDAEEAEQDGVSANAVFPLSLPVASSLPMARPAADGRSTIQGASMHNRTSKLQ